MFVAVTNAATHALEAGDSFQHGHPDQFALLRPQAERMLNLAPFVVGGDIPHSNNSILFHWNQMANRLLEADPDAGARLAARCIANFAMDNSVTAGFRPYPLKFLFRAAKVKPDVVWPAVTRQLEMPNKARGTWQLLNWLRGDQSRVSESEAGLGAIPTSMAFAWIDADIAQRAWLLAEYCPPGVSKLGEAPTFAREMLERYGAREDVRSSLHANHFTGSWRGSASEHYAPKLADLKTQLDAETNDHVRMWLKEHRNKLQQTIEHQQEQERRESEY